VYETQIRELELQHTALLTKADDLMAPYKGKVGENMTAEESESFGQILDDADEILKQIQDMKRAAGHKAFQRTPVENPAVPVVTEPVKDGKPEAAEVKAAFKNFLKYGERMMDAREHAVLRAYSAGSDTEGGFLVVPEEFVNEILKGVDDMVQIRQLATVIQLPKAESLGVPTLETDVNDADWTSELATGSLDEAMRIGKRELTPHPLAKRTKMSRKLMRAARIDPEALVRQRIQYKFGVTMEKAFLTGNGNMQPLGLFTASDNGIPTSRDVVTGSATDFTADGIINAAYFLKPQYWNRAKWLLHREALRNVRKLKDATGNYLWASGISTRTEPTIMDMPYMISEFAPNTFTNGNYAAVLGDYSFYWIAEALDMQVQVLTELYAETNQNGYIARVELDGAPVLAEAFCRLKFATS
jgi:HK97 family phage major capsid protein